VWYDEWLGMPAARFLSLLSSRPERMRKALRDFVFSGSVVASEANKISRTTLSVYAAEVAALEGDLPVLQRRFREYNVAPPDVFAPIAYHMWKIRKLFGIPLGYYSTKKLLQSKGMRWLKVPFRSPKVLLDEYEERFFSTCDLLEAKVVKDASLVGFSNFKVLQEKYQGVRPHAVIKRFNSSCVFRRNKGGLKRLHNDVEEIVKRNSGVSVRELHQSHRGMAASSTFFRYYGFHVSRPPLVQETIHALCRLTMEDPLFVLNSTSGEIKSRLEECFGFSPCASYISALRSRILHLFNLAAGRSRLPKKARIVLTCRFDRVKPYTLAKESLYLYASESKTVIEFEATCRSRCSLLWLLHRELDELFPGYALEPLQVVFEEV